MISRKHSILGAAAALLTLQVGCSSDATPSTEGTVASDEPLGVVVPSCTSGTGWMKAAGNVTLASGVVYAAAAGTLVIDGSGLGANSVVDVQPANGLVKVNGHTCTDGTGKALVLTSVKYLALEGKAQIADNFILDLSGGVPSALMADQHIIVDGQEVGGGGAAIDSLIIRMTPGADTLAVGQSVCYVGGGSCAAGQVTGAHADAALAVSFSTATLAAHLLYRDGADTTAGSNPVLSFDLGAGADVLNAMPASFEKVSGSMTMTAVTTAATGGTPPGMTIFGGPGNDTITPGKGPDVINGGGDSGDVVDYSPRTNPVMVELSSKAVGVWGPDLRGKSVGSGDCLSVNWGAYGATQITAGAAATTPSQIVSVLNQALNAASIGGSVSGTAVSGAPYVAQLIGPYLFMRGDATTTVANQPVVIAACGSGTEILTDLSWAPAVAYNSIANDGEAGENDDIQAVANVNGGAGNDILFGTSTSNIINGNGGDDVINGGPPPAAISAPNCAADADQLNGGAGNDWFDMNTADDCAQKVAGGAGTDLIDYSQRGNALTITLSGTAASGDLSQTPPEKDNLGSDCEVVLGGQGVDLITGTTNNDWLYGGPGADVIKGGAGDDVLVGGAGADELDGEAGNDTFFELLAEPGASAGYWPAAGAGTNNSGPYFGLPQGTWSATTAFSAGAFVNPQNGYYYKVTTAGTSGATAPVWPTAVNGTVTDGTAVWTCWDVTSPAFQGVALDMLGDSPGDGNDNVNGGNAAGESNHLLLGTDETATPPSAAAGGCSGLTNTLCYQGCVEAKLDGFTANGPCDPASATLSYDGVNAANSSNDYMNIQYVSGNALGPNVFIGSSQDEMFEGGAGVDWIVGMAGNDQMWGYANGAAVDGTSNDVLCGGDGSDTLYGGAAADLEGEGAGANGVEVTGSCAALTFANANSCFGTAQSCSPNVAEGFDQCYGNVTAADVDMCVVDQL